uniref:Odorant receptor n=1 Tax=Heliconius melpomene rosina TaxID=171916 RepID=A0A1S5XXP8_HELME|nr:olfactory receptor 45 [Heliconius melpomene rosina]
MVEFSDLPQEYIKPYSICFSLIQFNDFNFFDDHVPIFKKYWRFFVRMFLTSIQFVSMTIYLIRRLQGDFKIPELSYVISCYIVIIQGFVKFYIVLYNKTNIQKLILSLGVMWRTDNLTDIQIGIKNRFLKTLSVGQVVCYWSFFVAIWLNMSISFIITLVRKFILRQDTELMLAFGSVYIFFNTSEDWFLYIIAYLFQIYTMSGLGYMYFGIEFLTITLCAYLSTAFSLLRDDLKRLTPRNNRVNLNENLRNESPYTIEMIIKQHQKLIELTKLMNNSFSVIFFTNLSFVTFEICFYAFACIVAHTPMDFSKNILAVLIILPSIFILCYYSELLREESGGIAEAAYENLWYRGDDGYQKSIRFIIMRAQRPCSLMSLNYTPITLNTFTKVVSTTWSYLSVAITMYSKK